MIDEAMVKRLRKRLYKYSIQRLFSWFLGFCCWGMFMELLRLILYIRPQLLGTLESFKVLPHWGGGVVGFFITMLLSIIGMRAIQTLMYSGGEIAHLIAHLLEYSKQFQGNYDLPEEPLKKSSTKYLWRRKTFLGITLRQNFLSHGEFIKRLQRNLPRKKQIWKASGTLIITFFVGLTILVLERPLSAVTAESLRLTSWHLFAWGLNEGFLLFILIEAGVLCVVIALRKAEFQRIEELLVMYHDIFEEINANQKTGQS